MKKPSELYSQGFNCAESIIKCYNEEFNESIPVAIGSGMGRGAFSGSLCGSINASIAIIGFVKGREDNNVNNETSAYVKQLMTTIKEKYSTEICRDLKCNGVSCAEIMDFSYEALKEILR